MNEETNRSSNAHLPAVFSVTLLSRLYVCLCVYMCVCKRRTHIRSGVPGENSNAIGDREKERVSSFSSLFFSYFSLVIMIASISVVVSRIQPDGSRIVCVRATFSVAMVSIFLSFFPFSYFLTR